MCADVEADADDEGTACKGISCDECTEVTPEICENDQLYVPAADVRRMRQKQHALADGTDQDFRDGQPGPQRTSVEDAPLYVPAAEVRRVKQEQQQYLPKDINQDGRECLVTEQNGLHGQSDPQSEKVEDDQLYVSASEVRRRKEEQQQ
ncbi:uncharacterized protein [Littorina saxatilis]|uniref:uncharacterized protein n=1 Tax=Littorina saxatilis TaxID=31220 RepID=UPI0038B648C7